MAATGIIGDRTGDGNLAATIKKRFPAPTPNAVKPSSIPVSCKSATQAGWALRMVKPRSMPAPRSNSPAITEVNDPPTLHDGICTNNSYMHTYGGAITAPLRARNPQLGPPPRIGLPDGRPARRRFQPQVFEAKASRSGIPCQSPPRRASATQSDNPGSAGNPATPATPEAPATRQPGNPAIRQSGNPAIRQSGNPAPWHLGTLAPWHLGTLAPWHLGNPALRHSGTPALAVCLAEVGAAPGRAVSRLFPGPPFRRPPVSLCGGRGARRAGTQSPLFFFFFLSFFRLVH